MTSGRPPVVSSVESKGISSRSLHSVKYYSESHGPDFHMKSAGRVKSGSSETTSAVVLQFSARTRFTAFFDCLLYLERLIDEKIVE